MVVAAAAELEEMVSEAEVETLRRRERRRSGILDPDGPQARSETAEVAEERNRATPLASKAEEDRRQLLLRPRDSLIQDPSW